MRARLTGQVTKWAGWIATGTGTALRGARFLPSLGGAACLVVAGATVHPALGWAVAGVALLAADRRFSE